jgi:hypothetical protein
MAFGAWDYVVFITTLLISASIGVYTRFSGGKQKTANVRFKKILNEIVLSEKKTTWESEKLREKSL